MQEAFKAMDLQKILEQQKKLQNELKKRRTFEMVELKEVLDYEQPTKYIVNSTKIQ